MAYSKYNATAATLTKNRTVGSVTPNSGLCVTCVDGCVGMCEVGKSALRGSEVITRNPSASSPRPPRIHPWTSPISDHGRGRGRARHRGRQRQGPLPQRPAGDPPGAQPRGEGAPARGLRRPGIHRHRGQELGGAGGGRGSLRRHPDHRRERLRHGHGRRDRQGPRRLLPGARAPGQALQGLAGRLRDRGRAGQRGGRPPGRAGVRREQPGRGHRGAQVGAGCRTSAAR